jgi:hypothetical protein
MKRPTISREAERSVRSIAMALESLAAAEGVQDDLFGGPVQLEPSPYSSYHAELARRVCVQALRP